MVFLIKMQVECKHLHVFLVAGPATAAVRGRGRDGDVWED